MNVGSQDVDLTDYSFVTDVGNVVASLSASSFTLAPNALAIITSDVDAFKAEWAPLFVGFEYLFDFVSQWTNAAAFTNAATDSNNGIQLIKTSNREILFRIGYGNDGDAGFSTWYTESDYASTNGNFGASQSVLIFRQNRIDNGRAHAKLGWETQKTHSEYAAVFGQDFPSAHNNIGTPLDVYPLTTFTPPPVATSICTNNNDCLGYNLGAVAPSNGGRIDGGICTAANTCLCYAPNKGKNCQCRPDASCGQDFAVFNNKTGAFVKCAKSTDDECA